MKRPGRALDGMQSPFALFFALLFFAGQICGALYAGRNSSGYLHYFVTSYLQEHFSGSFTPVFSLSFLPVIGIHLLLVVLALSCAAAPVILLIPFIKGFSLGMIGALLYTAYGLKGILINVVLLWLPAVVQCAVLILFCCETIRASLELFNGVLLHKGFYNISIPDLVSSFVLWSAIGLGAAMLEGVLAMMLGSLF